MTLIMCKISIIGTGIIGSIFCSRLLDAGFQVSIYNRSLEKAIKFKHIGASIYSNPSEAVRGADIIISVVSDDEASRRVWNGPQGVFRSVNQNSLLIECSTLSLDWIQELSNLAAQHNCEFLDAPISGTKPQAQNGTLSFFVGGLKESLRRAEPILHCLSKKVYYLGATGNGMKMKLVNNLLNAAQILSLAEGLFLATNLELDLNLVLEILSCGSAGSAIVNLKGSKMILENTEVQSHLETTCKDLSYILEAAKSVNTTLINACNLHDIYSLAVKNGFGDQDVSSILQALKSENSL